MGHNQWAIKGRRSSDDTDQPVRIDKVTNSLQTIDYSHHEIHDGNYYLATTYDDSAATGEKVNIVFTTPASPKCHMLSLWSSGGAAIFRIYEAAVVTANNGTNALPIYNKNRNSTNTSGCLDNATVNAVGKYSTGTTITNTGTTIILEYSGVGKTVNGMGRSDSEFILKPSTKYAFEVEAIGNGIAIALLLDWYEHTDIT